jgi:hypothetical protein
MSNPFSVHLGISEKTSSQVLAQIELQRKYGSDPDHIGIKCLHAPKCEQCGSEPFRNQVNDIWCSNLSCEVNTGDLQPPNPQRQQ